ncbi:homoprotocatechuate degradation operon regulator HpaR [Psychrobacter immobilis]|uniref:homoprotocatechuate degradation operon regulator HpaR n=1 Tax=Psychrobacter immobilis TaxID=498 RepID=UPI001917DC06|nr:homoprotocatechuate degradation operon regulator HpaR [Psychrobacter immobilis]
MSQSYRNLPFLLLKARENLMVQFRPILNKYNVTEQQWRIIRALKEHGDLEPRQLCHYCIILSPSMAGILKRMEEAELIQKIPMEDQRRISIRLTDKAHELHTEALKESNLQYKAIEDKIGKKAMKELYVLLDDLIDEFVD